MQALSSLGCPHQKFPFPCFRARYGQVVTSLDEEWLAWMKEDCPLSLTWSCCKGAFHLMLFCAGFLGASDPRACFLELILPFTTAHLGQKATVLISVACSFSRENSSSSSNPITFLLLLHSLSLHLLSSFCYSPVLLSISWRQELGAGGEEQQRVSGFVRPVTWWHCQVKEHGMEQGHQNWVRELRNCPCPRLTLLFIFFFCNCFKEFSEVTVIKTPG